MPRYAQTFEKVIFDTGTYIFILGEIKDTVGKPFGAADDSKEQVKQWQWNFFLIDDAELDKSDQRMLIQSTGMTFGSKKGKLTKMYNGMEGRNKEGRHPLTTDEAKTIDADKYVGKAWKITVVREVNEQNEPTNRFAAIEPASKEELKEGLERAKQRKLLADQEAADDKSGKED